MIDIPICENCGHELSDALDVEIGWCMDCQMDDPDLFREYHTDELEDE